MAGGDTQPFTHYFAFEIEVHEVPEPEGLGLAFHPIDSIPNSIVCRVIIRSPAQVHIPNVEASIKKVPTPYHGPLARQWRDSG